MLAIGVVDIGVVAFDNPISCAYTVHNEAESKSHTLMPTATVTIPKTDYARLREKAIKFEFLTHFFTERFFEEPPVRDVSMIMRELRKTGNYNPAFLKSLKKGLQESALLSS